MTVLAQTYFRLNIHLDESDKGALKNYFLSRADAYAKDLFAQRPTFEVELEDGTLRGWLTVTGAIVTALSAYGGIRSTIDYLRHDARQFSERALTEIENSDIDSEDILRTERRLGVPGKLGRLFHHLDYLEQHGRDLSKAEYVAQIDWVKKETSRILHAIDNKKDQELVRSAIPEQIPEVPRRHTPIDVPGFSPVALRPEPPTLPGPSTYDNESRDKKVKRPREKHVGIKVRPAGIKFIRKP